MRFIVLILAVRIEPDSIAVTVTEGRVRVVEPRYPIHPACGTCDLTNPAGFVQNPIKSVIASHICSEGRPRKGQLKTFFQKSG